MSDIPSEREQSRAEQIVRLGQLSMRSQRDGDVHTVAVGGEMDIANAAKVEQELIRVEATDAGAIVLDLSGLAFIDSTGIRMLLMADARSRTDGDRLVLRRPPDAVQRVLRLAGVDHRLQFADG